MENKVHQQPVNTERLYLPREKLGRGLCNIEFGSELMLLELNNTLERSSQISIRRAAMLKVEKDNQTHLALIQKYLLVNYKSTEKFTKELLSEAQTKTLMVGIKNKECHQRLFRIQPTLSIPSEGFLFPGANKKKKKKKNQRLFKVCEHELADVKQSATWLTCGNIKPRDEASY